MRNSIGWAVVLLSLAVFILSFCNQPVQKKNTQGYLNHHDTVNYVGMNVCRNCHAQIYETFMRTGMGQSFHLATKAKSAAEFSGNAVFDSLTNFHYQPFWNNDSMLILEFRLQGKDTVYRRLENVSYIIGSGQHTNSHLCDFNGFLFQSPVTFYTQKRQWDMAPGFEGGFNSRFSRVIAFECMTCHNAMPDFDKESVNKYHHVPLGIDCERCHGPGEAHVNLKMAGVLVDTSRNIDYSIVNPKKLSKQLQMSLCNRCHLQGLSVLKSGKDFDDFKPGMDLKDVFDVFLPSSDESKNNFIMASQAERLMQSNCYKLSEMTCITCHNPHVSVKETPIEVFNAKCGNCHHGKNICSEKTETRAEKNDDCSGCHLPKSGSIDIPHVFITDHFIRKRADSENMDTAEIEKVKQYLALKCYTQENPSPAIMAEAYLSFYEKFSQRDNLLDSAAYYLFNNSGEAMTDAFIHYYFLKEDFNGIVALANKTGMSAFDDKWTLYRVGEAHYALGNFQPAHDYYKKALEHQPLNVDFQNKLAASLTQLGKFADAQNIYRAMLSAHPKFETAWSNLGFLRMREGDFTEAEFCLNKALALNPDYEMALANMAALCFTTRKYKEAEALAHRVLSVNPLNSQTVLLLKRLKEVQ